MATRVESVRLELVDNFSSGMARAAASTALLNRELDNLNGSASENSRSSQTITRNTDAVTRSSDRAGSSINQLDGRLKLIAQTASVLGPALIPIGSLAIPAVMGLTNQLGAAALAGGSLIVAFQGVADAVKAVDAYQLDPTVATLEKAREALKNLGPDARAFVGAFQDFQPILTNLRDAAAEGWFPGLTESLGNLERVAPKVESLLLAVSTAGGEALASATSSLAGERWAGFLEFLKVEMPGTLHDVINIVGNLTHGLSELWMAFDPLNDDFSDWMVGITESFDGWAEGLAQTEGFRDFVDYVRDSGPQVADTLGALASAVVDFIQAASPLGGPVLAAIEVFANAVSAIADSPIGPKLLTMAAAFVVLNKTLAITAGLMARLGFVGAAGALRGAMPGSAGGAAGSSTTGALPIAARLQATGASFRQFGRDLRTMGSLHTQVMARTASEQQRLAAAQQRAGSAMVGFGRSAGIGAAGAVAFAGATGRLGDGFHLTNTAMLGLMGSMLGPWGAAVGAGIGLVADLGDTTKDFDAAVQNAQRSIDNMDFSNYADGLKAVTAERDKLADRFSTDKDGWAELGQGLDPGYWKNSIKDLFGDSDVDDATQEMERLEKAAYQSQAAMAQLGRAAGMTVGPVDGSAKSIAQLNKVTAALQPSMDDLGITTEELNAAFATQAGYENTEDGLLGVGRAAITTATPFDDLKRKIAENAIYLESAAGKSKVLSDAFKGISAEALPASEKAAGLSAALDLLLDPALNAEAATDAWRLSLQGLRRDLDATAGFKGYGEAALANREMTRSYVEGVQARLVAMVAEGRSAQDVAKAAREARREFVQSGIDAGFSAKEIRKRADAMGLTPKMVKTIFEATGLVESTIRAEETKRLYNSLPRKIQTDISTNGIPKTQKDLKDLDERMGGLTKKERRIVVALLDLAGGKLKGINKGMNDLDGKTSKPKADLDDNPFKTKKRSVENDLNKIDGKTAKPKVDLSTGDFMAQIGSVRNNLSDLDGSSASVYIRTFRTGAQPAADGATVPKTGRPYADRHPYLLADGEEVVSNRYGQADRNRAELKAASRGAKLAVVGYADGGTTGYRPSMNSYGGPRGQMYDWASIVPVAQMNALGVGLIRELKLRTKLLQKEVERDQRAADREKQRLDMLKQERRQIAGAVAGRFADSPFAAQQPDTYLPGINTALAGNPEALAEARERSDLINQLRAKGVPVALLVALKSATTDELRALVAYDEAALDRFEEQYNRNQVAATPSGMLQSQIKDAREFLRLLKLLEAQGLTGAALADAAQNASLAQLNALASGGRGGVQEYTDLFNQRDRIAQQAGNFVGDSLYGQQIEAQAKVAAEHAAEAKESRQALNRIERQLAQAEKQRQRDSDRETAATERVRDAIKGETGKVGRSR